MRVLAIVDGTGTGTAEIADSFVEHLEKRGTVGRVVEDSQTTADGREQRDDATSGDQTYWLSESGEWMGSGASLSLDDVLDRLAQTCEYAVVEGYPDARLPKLVVGDAATDGGRTLATVDSPADIDVPLILDALEEVDPYETLGSLVARVKHSADEEYSGAIATFTGRVRAKEHEDDDPTEYLEFERYDAVAEQQLATIKRELESREKVYEVLLHHRTGAVDAGEDIVFVVVLAGHREQAFRTVEDGINRLKAEVPLFKKEVTVSDEFWAHEGPKH